MSGMLTPPTPSFPCPACEPVRWFASSHHMSHDQLHFAAVGFSSVAGLTWFFSSRRRLFIRVFVPRDERDAIRRILRDPGWERGMRIIVALQTVAAAVFVALALWRYFF